MSESPDQPVVIVPDATQTDVQTLSAKDNSRQRSPASERVVFPESDAPATSGSGKATALPVPVVLAPQAETKTAGFHASAGSALPGAAEAKPNATAEAKPNATAEVHLDSTAFRAVPPRPKKPRSVFEDNWIRAAAVAAALGIGWIAGANTFDRGEDVRRLALQLHSAEGRLSDVAKAARVGPQADLAVLRNDVASLRRSVDGLGRGLDTQRAGLGTTKASLDTTKTSLDTMRGDLDSIRSGLQAAQAGIDASKPEMAKLDQLAERVGRLERQLASPMPTGSIAPAPGAPAAASSASVPAKDPHALPGSDVKAAVEKPKPPLNGYVLRAVHDGVALVEDRSGLHKVVAGEVLAGAGRVEAIERRGHQWVVVTSDGVIDSDPD